MSTSLFFYFLHHNVTENKHAKYMFYSPIFNLFLHSVGLKILNKQIYWSGAKAGKKWQKEHLKLRSDTIVWNLNYNETMLIRPQETGFSNEKIDGCLANTEKKKKKKKPWKRGDHVWWCSTVEQGAVSKFLITVAFLITYSISLPPAIQGRCLLMNNS